MREDQIFPEATDDMITAACDVAGMYRVDAARLLEAALRTMPAGLHTFLDAAAGEGLVLDGIDAADLYVALFPERYADTLNPITTGDGRG